MDLMSQLISYGLAQEGRKKEVLHGIKSIRPVEATFIVVLFPGRRLQFAVGVELAKVFPPPAIKVRLFQTAVPKICRL